MEARRVSSGEMLKKGSGRIKIRDRPPRVAERVDSCKATWKSQYVEVDEKAGKEGVSWVRLPVIW